MNADQSSSEARCGRCGGPVRAHVAGGLCVRCLADTVGFDWLDDGADAAANSKSEAGSPSDHHPPRFGDFELGEELGRGGIGVVYRARQVNLGREVALKMLMVGPLARRGNLDRFKLEAAAAAGLRHPGIVAIHEIGEHAGQPYLVLDLIEGPSLATAIETFHQPLRQRGGHADWKRVAGWLRGVAGAVQHAHDRGIVHRDLKPTNILVDGEDRPHVTDFGLAKRLAHDSSLTLSGQVLGTPAYIAPELIPGAGNAGPLTDIYGLGAVLYQALTGRPPFGAESLEQTLQQVLTVEPVAPRLVQPLVPAELEIICLKCLEKDPGRRYGTAGEVADELGRYLAGEPILARPVGPVSRMVKWARRRPTAATAMGLTITLLLTLLVGGPLVTWRINRALATAENNLYAADLFRAQQALADGDLGQARKLLARYAPESSDRPAGVEPGWEWRHLSHQTRGDAHRVLGRMSSNVERMAVSPDGR